MQHRGEIVKKILTQKGTNITKMADDLGYKRQTLYNQLDRADMFDSYILKIGEYIGYDFSELIKGIDITPSSPTKWEEEQGPYEQDDDLYDELDVTVKLDGTDETLKKIFAKLQRVNTALSSQTSI